MKKTGQKERRRAPRINLDYAMVDVYPQKVVNENVFRGKIFNISTVGVKFTSFEPSKPDSKVYIRLLLPNNDLSSDDSFIEIPGRVVRCEQIGNEGYYIAVELKEDCIQQSLIEDFIKLMKKRDKDIILNDGDILSFR